MSRTLWKITAFEAISSKAENSSSSSPASTAFSNPMLIRSRRPVLRRGLLADRLRP
ncbi:hypothetical protein [Streptomyces sp. S.PNR 29]|uniref:hypothetical protein n=1 Tax=Streptomyces sp. S.PNR 29 TaxID=2973805 RepID=UPI0025AEF387|nr:hypothetical protein [Streptomyces sp. S.PNR 29]MDN0200011.1 hypothetical protein [Streptomyces sp. S.PNR 29]